MVIKKLTLHNFGVYASTNTFEFQNMKSVVLIGGMNGCGKTTFLESILLVLYGANSFAYTENKRQTYGQYLRSFVNSVDGTLESYVEIEFSMTSEEDDSIYVVNRRWSAHGKRTSEIIDVQKNGRKSEFLTDHWPMFIENILPSGLSSFFFFDGEKIAQLAVEETDDHLKESIKYLLGITTLDFLQNDLNRIIKKRGQDVSANYDAKRLELLRQNKDEKENELNILEEELAQLQMQIEKIKHKIEKQEANYLAKGGDVATSRHDLFQERSYMQLRIEQIKEKLIDLSAGELPLLLVKPLLEKILFRSLREQEEKATEIAVDKLDGFFAQFLGESPDVGGEVERFMTFVKNRSEPSPSLQVRYDLSDYAVMQCKYLCDTQLADIALSVFDLQDDLMRANGRLDEIDNYLSIEIDENAITTIYKKMRILQQELVDLEVQFETKSRIKAERNGEYAKISSEFNKSVENALTTLEQRDDHERILQYAYHATAVLEEYKIRLQSSKIGELSDIMISCYKKLSKKKNLIEEIRIDPITLDFQYLNKDGGRVSKASLSAGEKQLMVISMLWALAICSKKKLPVIIDTPLSRLDSAHRTTLIKTYFPNASEQTIILSTDSEVDAHYYKIMKPTIGDEFTLNYNDSNKASTIQRGYFKGVIQ